MSKTMEQTFEEGDVFHIRLRDLRELTVTVSDVTESITTTNGHFGQPGPMEIVLTPKGERLLRDLFAGQLREAIDVEVRPVDKKPVALPPVADPPRPRRRK